MTLSPATPSAFGCIACVESARRAQAAENATARLLTLTADKDSRLDAARREIGALEAQIARGRPSLWQAEENT